MNELSNMGDGPRPAVLAFNFGRQLAKKINRSSHRFGNAMQQGAFGRN